MKKVLGLVLGLVMIMAVCMFSQQAKPSITLSKDLLDISTIEIDSNKNKCEFNVEEDSQWISATLTKECSYYKKYRGSIDELDHVYFKDSEGNVVKEVNLYRDDNHNRIGVVSDGNIYICDGGEVEITLDHYIRSLQMQKMKSWMNVGV